MEISGIRRVLVAGAGTMESKIAAIRALYRLQVSLYEDCHRLGVGYKAAQLYRLQVSLYEDCHRRHHPHTG